MGLRKLIEARLTVEIMPTTELEIIFDYPRAPFNRQSITNEILRVKKKFMLYAKLDSKPYAIPERMIASGITNSWYIALDCFGIQQYHATILFASIAVEVLLNHDGRLYQYRLSLPQRWIDLSFKNLCKAKEVGIDITSLLDRDAQNSEFIVRRNKIAHGDLSGYCAFLAKSKPNREVTEKSAITRKQALNQLNRSFRFITEWARNEPTIILDETESFG